MSSLSYRQRRGQLETYFDRTALDAWARLTSDAPLGRIRSSVRAGRERMREQLLDWLPADLHGVRLLDAGCGTGALAVAAAQRGAEVVAVDLSPSLIRLAGERAATLQLPGRIEFLIGDLLDPTLGRFDYLVAMDSLIHYRAADTVAALSTLGARTGTAMLFTFVPGSRALCALHALGRRFPRGNRAPAVEPVAERRLQALLEQAPRLSDWRRDGSRRIQSGFYTSQAVRLSRG